MTFSDELPPPTTWVAHESAVTTLPRYERSLEEPDLQSPDEIIPPEDTEQALLGSQLSRGSRELARALLRTSAPRVFPGGGVGIEYGALLKTATRPDLIAAHVSEVAAHLHAAEIDVLFVPGMSGYPIGAMYSQASAIPAILLKKQLWRETQDEQHPVGAFLIPSYTGSGDTVISADPAAARDILAGIIDRQFVAQRQNESIELSIRIAGADEIIDKATMATAITETAPVFCRSIVDHLMLDRVDEIADRNVLFKIQLVTWVTPIVKGYNHAAHVLRGKFGVDLFAGLSLTSLHLDPPAIGIDGVGVLTFPDSGARS